MIKRLIVIGDVHGTHLELQKLLVKLEANTDTDLIWCTGDAFDRAGKDCAQKVYEIFKTYKIQYIYGNHDSELADKIRNNKPIHKPWYKDWWESFSDEAKKWFLDSQKYYEFIDLFGKKILLVHAGVDSCRAVDKTDPRVLCTLQCIEPRGTGKPYSRMNKDGSNAAYFWTKWLSDELNNNYKDMTIVFGHTTHWPKDERHTHCDKFNVSTFNNDWGSVHGGELAAVVFEEGKVYFESVKSVKDYYFESYKQK